MPEDKADDSWRLLASMVAMPNSMKALESEASVADKVASEKFV